MSNKVLYHIDNDLVSDFTEEIVFATLFSLLVLSLVWRTFHLRRIENRKHLDGAHVFGCVSLLIGAIILWWSVFEHFSNHFELGDRLRSGAVEIVRGSVSIVSPFPPHGHGQEKVRIGEQLFDYSPNDLTQRGLRSPGVLIQGMRVEVSHVEGAIVKVELLSQRDE